MSLRQRLHTSAGQRRGLVHQAGRTVTRGQHLQHLRENSTDLLCLHPDAIRRRLEQEEWRRQREAEKQRAAQLEGLGLKWYDAPSTMISCSSPEQYRKLVDDARQQGRLLVAKMFTEECYVCKSLYPKMRKIAADNPDVCWVKLNGSDPALVELFTSLGVTRVPLFHFVLDGHLVSELSASLNPERLAAFRAELAAHKPQARKETLVPQHSHFVQETCVERVAVEAAL